MPYKGFNTGDVLTAADVNTYLMNQAVITCTSATRPTTPNEGMVIYETDTDLVRIYNGSSWVTWFHVGAGKVGMYRVGENTRTADSGAFTSVEAAIDSVTVPLVNGRTYKVRWSVAWNGTVAGDTVFTRLRETNVSGNQLTILRSEIVATGGAGTRWDATVEAEYTAVATGNKTFVGTGIRATGSGNINAAANTDMPIYLTVDYVKG